MNVKLRALGEPVADERRLMRAVIVQDDVNPERSFANRGGSGFRGRSGYGEPLGGVGFLTSSILRSD